MAAVRALTPAPTTAGLFALARVLNRQAPAVLPWALLLVFNYPFLWGFLNFALAILALAGWVALAHRVRWRAVLFLAITPLLLIGHGVAGAVIVVLLLFLATPSLISGSDRIDTRLAPLIPILALTLQDWSAVGPRRRRLVLVTGLALLALRFGVTAKASRNTTGATGWS